MPDEFLKFISEKTKTKKFSLSGDRILQKIKRIKNLKIKSKGMQKSSTAVIEPRNIHAIQHCPPPTIQHMISQVSLTLQKTIKIQKEKNGYLLLVF